MSGLLIRVYQGKEVGEVNKFVSSIICFEKVVVHWLLERKLLSFLDSRKVQILYILVMLDNLSQTIKSGNGSTTWRHLITYKNMLRYLFIFLKRKESMFTLIYFLNTKWNKTLFLSEMIIVLIFFVFRAIENIGLEMVLIIR